MIHLRPDCLVFETASGEHLPCPVKEVTLELVGESAQWVDSEIVANAAAAVLHYFRTELKQENVSLPEFATVLEKVLRGMGLDVKGAEVAAAANAVTAPPAAPLPASEPAPEPAPAAAQTISEADLHALAGELEIGGELFFLPRLRDEMRRHLDGTPRLLRFRNLRACVRRLTGAKRWTSQCRALEDRIIDYLRTCLGNEQHAAGCALVVE